MTTSLSHCSFCAKHKDQVGKLIVSHDVAICSECIELCNNLLRDSRKPELKSRSAIEIPDPLDLKNYLDQYVIGQEQSKRVLSVAVTNHFKRINRGGTDLAKSNILMIGPTGTGKTLMASTVAQYLNVPFVIADATTLTEAGYVGDDVESLISRLYTAADGNIEQCQRGIVFLDEIDKISRKSESATVTKDVSGEGVQQALLKLVEGVKCRIPASGSRKSSQQDMIEIDTTNILFVASGAFVGLDRIVQKRKQGTAIGFNSQLQLSDSADLTQVTPDDLVRYGMIPEFVGRFGSYVGLHSLDKTQLISILTKIKNNFVEQYQWLFNQDGVGLEFDAESLDLIAERTLATQTGARGLHSELERILLPHMFDLPRYNRQNILKVTINKTQVNTPMTLLQENL